ncbi:hypothetical protein FF021_07020 [Leptospira noguchii]|nr:hypothetical protein FF021_07020 [Leptospira noguchii]
MRSFINLCFTVRFCKCGNYYKLKFHNETFKNSGILFELVRKNRCGSSHILKKGKFSKIKNYLC